MAKSGRAKDGLWGRDTKAVQRRIIGWSMGETINANWEEVFCNHSKNSEINQTEAGFPHD